MLRDPNARTKYNSFRDDPHFYWYFHDDAWLDDPFDDDDFGAFDKDDQSNFDEQITDSQWEGT
jgi:hypothetical protein